jgi:hypothetical protein
MRNQVSSSLYDHGGYFSYRHLGARSAYSYNTVSPLSFRMNVADPQTQKKLSSIASLDMGTGRQYAG